jgi:nitrogen fixation NifU-like protein
MTAFPKKVIEHFKNPRHSGELPSATHRVEVTNPVCGDVLQLAACIENGVIIELKFLCRGCTTAIACASWVAESLNGASTELARTLSADAISEGLGGLPEETGHAAVLAADAVKVLLRESQKKPG